MTKKYDLKRFLKMQELDYTAALSEIKSGRKKTHWIWYIFPQIKGLGLSDMANFYAIADIEEAREYINHPILGSRLIEISKALLALDSDNPTDVMGIPDDIKLCSCMTLFEQVSDNTVFTKVLEKYFAGNRDKRTLEILNK